MKKMANGEDWKKKNDNSMAAEESEEWRNEEKSVSMKEIMAKSMKILIVANNEKKENIMKVIESNGNRKIANDNNNENINIESKWRKY